MEQRTWWNATEDDALLELIDAHYQRDQRVKLGLARTWEENIRFIDGDQYIRYNTRTWSYEPIPSRIETEYIPRPRNNLLWSRTEKLRANLTQQTPTFQIEANSSDPRDERKAKVAEGVLRCRQHVDRELELRAECAEWAVATGNAFMKVVWAPTESVPIAGPDAEIVEMPVGDVQQMVPSPFRIAPDSACSSLRDCKVIMEYAFLPVDEIQRVWGQEGEGYTGHAKDVADEDLNDSILKIDFDLRRMMRQTGYESQYKELGPGAVVKETYIAPGDGHPHGRQLVAAGGKLLYNGAPKPVEMGLDYWHPYRHMRYKVIPGSFWGRTPVTQSVPLQRRINAIDALEMLHRQTMAVGQWLIPRNTVRNAQFTGRVGLKIYYKMGPKGEKPERLAGTDLPRGVLEERNQVIQDMDEIMGTNDVPMEAGDVSGLALETLREQRYSRHHPLHARWEAFLEQVAQQKLQLIATFYDNDRPKFTQMLRRTLHKLHGIDIQDFMGGMIADNCHVRIEGGSSFPRSFAGQLDYLRQFGEAGLLGDLVNDPHRNQLFLQKYGIDEFKTAQNADYEKAKWELGMIEQGQAEAIGVHPEDDDALHMAYFASMLKDPTYFTSRDPQVVQAAWLHYQQHQQAFQQKQAAQQQNEREMLDEEAYRKALTQHGGPGRSPPNLSLFPAALIKTQPDDIVGQGGDDGNDP